MSTVLTGWNCLGFALGRVLLDLGDPMMLVGTLAPIVFLELPRRPLFFSGKGILGCGGLPPMVKAFGHLREEREKDEKKRESIKIKEK